eukprot:353257-Chlamydomonas_euryale.AAC.4
MDDEFPCHASGHQRNKSSNRQTDLVSSAALATVLIWSSVRSSGTGRQPGQSQDQSQSQCQSQNKVGDKRSGLDW